MKGAWHAWGGRYDHTRVVAHLDLESALVMLGIIILLGVLYWKLNKL